MESCELQLLGSPRIIRDGRIVQISLRKAVALVAYLAVEGRAFSRDYLATLLWPEYSQKRGLANLRRTLTELRKTLENGCILTSGDQVALDAQSVRIDVSEFHRLVETVNQDGNLEDHEAACALYRSSFMEGFSLGDCLEYDEWQDQVREKLQADFDRLLESLVADLLERHDHERALPYARRWLDLDNLNETAHRALMQIHVSAGRQDLARRQYEHCVQALNAEGLEPADETRTLASGLLSGNHSSGPNSQRVTQLNGDSGGRPGGPAGETPRTVRFSIRPLRWAAIAAGTFVVLAIGAGFASGFFRRADYAVESVEVTRANEELSAIHIRFRHSGNARRLLPYTVIFTSTALYDSPRRYLAYSGEVRVRPNTTHTISLDASDHFGLFIDENEVAIPPGYYTASVVIDPVSREQPHSGANNLCVSDDLFCFEGATGIGAVEVLLSYEGSAPLDEDNPVQAFVNLPGDGRGQPLAGPYRLTEPGRYVLPIGDLDQVATGPLPRLILIHDIGADLPGLDQVGPEDGAAIVCSAEPGLVYGEFSGWSGSELADGDLFRVTFSVPEPPVPDGYEPDSDPLLATRIDPTVLPVRQHRTFHRLEDGEVDHDWFRIFLQQGESVIVETFADGSGFVCDTQIDISDARVKYLQTARKKNPRDNYSLMEFTNETGVDQDFHVAVKPSDALNGLVASSVGEYVVEFR